MNEEGKKVAAEAGTEERVMVREEVTGVGRVILPAADAPMKMLDAIDMVGEAPVISVKEKTEKKKKRNNQGVRKTQSSFLG